MRKLERLIREAREAATWRGHKLPQFTHNRDGTVAWARCLNCGEYAEVETEPAPNSIELHGTILALNCTGHASFSRD